MALSNIPPSISFLVIVGFIKTLNLILESLYWMNPLMTKLFWMISKTAVQTPK